MNYGRRHKLPGPGGPAFRAFWLFIIKNDLLPYIAATVTLKIKCHFFANFFWTGAPCSSHSTQPSFKYALFCALDTESILPNTDPSLRLKYIMHDSYDSQVGRNGPPDCNVRLKLTDY